MGKIANATKPCVHSFEFNGEVFTLMIRTDFTSEEFEDIQSAGKRAAQEQDSTQVAEVIKFLLIGWDVEGSEGLIDFKDTKKVVKTVPFLLLEAISTQAQRALTSGGLVKKI